MRRKDLAGQTNGQLTAIRQDGRNDRGKLLWLCRCNCGNTTHITTSDFSSTKSCGCLYRKHNHLEGKRFGKLLVIDQESSTYPQMWNCVCDCGRPTTVIGLNLVSGGTQSCGCIHKQCLQKLNVGKANYSRVGGVSHRYINLVHLRAKTRGLACDITGDDMWDQFQKQDGKCALSGVELSLDYSPKDNQQTASLDRVDNTRGYTRDNIQWLHRDVNMIKYVFDVDYVKYIAWRVSEFHGHDFSHLPVHEYPKHFNFKGVGNIGLSDWSTIVGQRRTKDIKLEIDIGEAWDLFKQQGGRCSLTGLKLWFTRSVWNKTGRTTSLDRIDPNGHYTLDNVQWVHKDINRMKNEFSQEVFITWCQLITRNNTGLLHVKEESHGCAGSYQNSPGKWVHR